MSPGRPLGDVLNALQTDPTDEKAWADLYRSQWAYVLHLSHQSLGQSVDINSAEDLAQDVFSQLSRQLHLGKLRLPKSLGTFRALLGVITRNRAADLHRRSRRKNRDVGRNDPLSADIPTSAASPEQVAASNELFDELLERLDPMQQQLLWLLVEGQSQSEIAEQLGISVRTMQRHLNIVRKLFAALLDR